MPLISHKHYHGHVPHGINHKIDLILENTEALMADTAQVLAELAAANASLDGIVADIAALEAIIAAGGTPEEVAAAVHALSEKTAGIDAQRS